MTELKEYSGRWNAVQTKLNELSKQREEIERQFNEAWTEQNELHKEGIIAGYKLNRRTMEWSE